MARKRGKNSDDENWEDFINIEVLEDGNLLQNFLC